MAIHLLWIVIDLCVVNIGRIRVCWLAVPQTHIYYSENYSNYEEPANLYG